MATPVASGLVSVASRRASRPARSRRAPRPARVSAEADSASPDASAETAKRALLAAVAASRKAGADARSSKRAILDAVATLEPLGAVGGSVPFADVSGRWSLVYSTNDDRGAPALGPLAAVLDDGAFQRVGNQPYKAFFSFAPALAGSAETARQSQRQTSTLPPDASSTSSTSRICSGRRGCARRRLGEIEAPDAEAREVAVTFTEGDRPGAEKSARARSGGGDPPAEAAAAIARGPATRLRTRRCLRGGRGGVHHHQTETGGKRARDETRTETGTGTTDGTALARPGRTPRSRVARNTKSSDENPSRPVPTGTARAPA